MSGGFLVAVVEMILRLEQVVNAPFFALTIVGPVAMIVEIWWIGRRPRPVASPLSAG